MVKPVHPTALFRLSVLGPLVSRGQLKSGELKRIIEELSQHDYRIPDSERTRLSPKTIERWYYLWRYGGVDALAPQPRKDKGYCQINDTLQDELIATKKAQPSRSIRNLILLLELKGVVAKGELARSSVHRLLKQHGLSKRCVSDGNTIERRAFEAKCAGDIWYGDVMHGIAVNTPDGMRKSYCVSLMDDASRLLCHSAFYLSETAIAIEHVLKEALLKRGLPKKLIVDNGSAYRSSSLKQICARLNIHLIFCRPYEPEGKGKLERWHRTLRQDFMAELGENPVLTLDDLNARLWLWIERIYHQRQHAGLDKQVTPLQRWQNDLPQVRQLGALAAKLDQYFYHRIKRKVRKDGIVSYENCLFEVPYELSGQTIYLVIDPHPQDAKWVESLDYEYLGPVHLLDKRANCHRSRQRPDEKKPVANQYDNGLIDALLEKSKADFDIT